jgi:hypothetical protein
MPKRKQHVIPEVGTTFERTYKGKKFRLKVASDAQGTIYVLNSQAFRSPSAAAKSIVKHAINGWEFWNMARTRPDG